jgi:hypothetical protein
MKERLFEPVLPYDGDRMSGVAAGLGSDYTRGGNMAADPIAKLRSVGMGLPPKVRAEVLALAPEVIPRLVEVLDDVEGGWASVHAADLLVDLRADEAIGPMLRLLAELDVVDALYNRIAARLPELGAVILEPALAFLAASQDDDETVQNLCEVLVRLGTKDERIFEAVTGVFENDEVPGAALFADYGDPRALPVLEGAIANFEPDFAELWSRANLSELLGAHESLGGVLDPDVRARVDGWFAEWDARRRAAKAAAPAQRRKVGRNEPCPCGSGKKFKKCCLASGEAARPRVVEANGDRLLVSAGVSDEEVDMAAQYFREKDAGRGPAQQMAEYAKPIVDATDGSLGSIQAALHMGMLFWNLAILRDQTEREEALAEMALRLDQSDRPEFEQTARMMVDRHRAMFPEMHGGR